MKKTVYAGILSLLSGCASHTTFIEHAVISDEGIGAIYVQQSDGDCYFKAPQEDNAELRIYDQGCDGIADTVGTVSKQEEFYFLHDRKELNRESQQYLDTLLQRAVQQINHKPQEDTKPIRGYNEILF